MPGSRENGQTIADRTPEVTVGHLAHNLWTTLWMPAPAGGHVVDDEHRERPARWLSTGRPRDVVRRPPPVHRPAGA